MVDEPSVPVAKTEVVPLFPTFVWKSELKPETYGPMNETIKAKLRESTASLPALAPGEKWQTSHELHTLQEFSELTLYINASVKGVLDFLKIVYESFFITGCWANISAKGVRHKTHTHPNNFLSGVYYVQAAAGANTITFEDPRPQTYVIAPAPTERSLENADSNIMPVKEGMLVVFPAWLPHSVDVNQSDQERISISFNVMFSSFGEKMSKPQWIGNVKVK
ncbi:MAG: 2OG-Fe(II) oxygenase family protein [Gammaproteobacteria bacterium]|jgi:uncharacterized protein (TIGR02466 family)|nr:2OG-Fe(II) oxygenase family protein [Gammaproteobacteria bacterium]